MAVAKISECFIKPKHMVEEAKQPCYLAPGDLFLLSMNYMQKVFLFAKPSPTEDEKDSICILLEKLKCSLSVALAYFYPLAGQMVTQVNESEHSCSVFIDCNKGPGARFIHAAANNTTSNDILSVDVPPLVQSFFDLGERAVNYDFHIKPLLSIQVTELIDGIFISCSMNHSVADGTSLWHFIYVWSEICKENGQGVTISNPPIHHRWFLENHSPIITLPYTHLDEHIIRWEPLQLKARIFHISPDSMAKLKAIANHGHNTYNISSFQALSALIWQSITRARCLENDQNTYCVLVASSRHRVNPPVPTTTFCNAIDPLLLTLTTKELLGSSLSNVARLLQKAITNQKPIDWMKSWMESPFTPPFGPWPNRVAIGGSARLSTCGPLFGLGRAMEISNRFVNKLDGKVTLNHGNQGARSVVLEVCLSPQVMSALESDHEFMAGITLPSYTY